jgi:hypothetical protein
MILSIIFSPGAQMLHLYEGIKLLKFPIQHL